MGLFSKRTKFDKASAEKGLGITRKYNLAGGKSYVVEESPPDISFDAFVNIISTSSRDQPATVDGMEYPVSNNDFNKVLRVIDQVNDHISQGTAIMIIPVDPRAFEAKELALLAGNVEKLSSKVKPAK